VLQLEKDLEIEATRKGRDNRGPLHRSSPEVAALVLQTLANLYLEKHLKLHRPAGTQEFFQTQTDQYAEQLRTAENNLATFQRQQDFTSLEPEKQLNLQKTG
jgi:uncharacterized protein involved in exopolysaccharide biosynthesis